MAVDAHLKYSFLSGISVAVKYHFYDGIESVKKFIFNNNQALPNGIISGRLHTYWAR
ncbi:hypothetical protein YPPY13_0317 [Yersinia pestis PY-13]|uniref:Uncharacterized protein n=1 Tax=Yersinia pestis PY-08 TaxID=992134 RepID=A0AB72ZQM4_YERPE|nr:hypothetical protein YPPY01_0243 [Yersinia pestis PY-01]EIR08982.1 hypothetical protein YPPY04_0298 [Yersinia pestis PY-04]EIR09444.1 hypothetical protein YPPY05_0269 [Yersinia pestis PY-05]EIR11447.1 hypothetical protein YPPY06_0293 [Yersinia pestis PY-06]EIR23392.1 hypothetical protein YPPY07_0205 [Yersinia pestis PY-07]EIR24778.1 hypothetical protein YPPY08_0305 [Yersinia pestis PY-08]EIR26699.1 hypothetical protein YPPY09_0313 [Yersinia pestis PY-09]EIR39099.1 hypothetical protein YPP